MDEDAGECILFFQTATSRQLGLDFPVARVDWLAMASLSVWLLLHKKELQKG